MSKDMVKHDAGEMTLANQNNALNDLLFDDAKFNRLHQFAVIMADGRTTVPKHLQGNVADCLAVCFQSSQWGLNPIVVAQKTHLVNGTLGYEAQLVHAVILSSNLFDERPDFEYVGDWSKIRGKRQWNPQDEEGLGVKVVGHIDGKRKEWTTYMTECVIRNSPNWKSKPMLQCSYQSIKEFCREHCPDVLLGVYTTDELYDERAKITVTEVPEGGTRTDRLSSVLGIEGDDDINVEPQEVETPPEAPQEESPAEAPKRVSKKMLDEALETSGVSADMLFDYGVAKGAIKNGGDIYNLPANWKRSIVEDPAALNAKVNEWLADEEAKQTEAPNIDKLRRNFHAVGVEVYGEDWDEVRNGVCQNYGVSSSNDLTAQQLTDAIARMRRVEQD